MVKKYFNFKILIGITSLALFFACEKENVGKNDGNIVIGKDQFGATTKDGMSTVMNGAYTTLEINGGTGLYAGGKGNKVINYGKIVVNSGYGILVGSQAVGNNYGEINVNSGIGMASKKEVKDEINSSYSYARVQNFGTINVSGGIGMSAISLAHALNYGTINVNGSSGIGMNAVGTNSLSVNHGTINLNSDFGVGMASADGGNIINYGIINANGEATIAMSVGYGSTFENKGIIYLNGNNSIGIFSRGAVTNSGSIYVREGAKGTYYTAEGAVITQSGADESSNLAGGKINAFDLTGMLATTDAGAIVSNYGEISVSWGTGMRAEYSSLAYNKNGGLISVRDNGFGMVASGTIVYDEVSGVYTTTIATAKNYGTITLSGNMGTAMAALKYGIVQNYGTIYLNGDGNVGMIAVGPETKLENNGTINLRGKNGIALMISGGGQIVNYGAIIGFGTSGNIGSIYNTAILSATDSNITNDGYINVGLTGLTAISVSGATSTATNKGKIFIYEGKGIESSGGATII
ncbi:MAG: hypothetical protein ACRCSK_00570, partial [Fusobacteriaceae bacterium]